MDFDTPAHSVNHKIFPMITVICFVVMRNLLVSWFRIKNHVNELFTMLKIRAPCLVFTNPLATAHLERVSFRLSCRTTLGARYVCRYILRQKLWIFTYILNAGSRQAIVARTLYPQTKRKDGRSGK